MDCYGFETLLHELERDLPLPAEARVQALQHAESCAYCRARLAAARLLSLELQALAKHDEKLQAPAHLEARLLEALRARSRSPARVWRGLTWAAVAAGVVLAGALAAERPWRHASPPPAQVQAVQPAPKAGSVETAKSTSAPKAASAEGRVQQGGYVAANRVRPPRSRPTASRAAADVASEFVALPYAGTFYPVGDGMVVRVEVPPSARALVGLPIGAGDMAGPITADIVLGQDGVARAIRFVQPGEGKGETQHLDFQQN